jgi:hypothetical protein
VASWNFTSQANGSTVWKTLIVMRAIGGRRVAPLLERYVLGTVMLWLTKMSARRVQALAEREYRMLVSTDQAVTVAA